MGHEGTQVVEVGDRRLPLHLTRNPRARRYVMRMVGDAVQVTVPDGGTFDAAREFAQRNSFWIEQQLRCQALRPAPKAWTSGTEILLRGECVRLEEDRSGTARCVRFGTESVRLPAEFAGDLRPIVEQHLRHLATVEFPLRVRVLALRNGISITQVTIRGQSSRWGSSSSRGTISLNWRLIQAPESVRDYVIFHELAHQREMNHSPRFWREVQRLCPDYLHAERWLKRHSSLLH